MIGLEPVFSYGKELVERFETWAQTRKDAPTLRKDFSIFHTNLKTRISNLPAEITKLPQFTQDIIKDDVPTLTRYLEEACEALQDINRRLNRNPVFQFYRAKAMASDCHRLKGNLNNAQRLLRDNKIFSALSQQVESIPFKIKDGQPVDSFRPSFPLLTSVSAVLDFDTKGENGDPLTPEGILKQHLLEETSDSPNIFTIYGMGGVGKSTVVQALSRDDQIRLHFSDGVHQVKLGQGAKPATLLRKLCQVLRDSGAEKTCASLRVRNDTDEVLDFFEKWFDGKNCVFIIDDVWVHAIGLPLLSRLCNIGSGMSGNTVLMTTREHEVASLAPCEKMVPLEPREPRGQIARQILFLHASYQDLDHSIASVQESINGILDICAGLPVSLAVAGKNVKKMGAHCDKKVIWKRYLSQLMISRDRLLRQDVGTYGNLFATLETSISFLDERPQEDTLGLEATVSFAEMYRRLCVLEKQLAVPLSMLRHLWQTRNATCADVIATAFEELGLVRLELVGEDTWHLSLHDSLHDYAVAESKRNGDATDAHEFLIIGYKSSGIESSCEESGISSWWSPKLEVDGYVHMHLCRHLLGAKRADELVQLLMSPQWAERQVQVNGVSFLEADLSLGLQAIQNGVIKTSDPQYVGAEIALQLISQAVTISSSFIASNAAELYFQLHGRLKGFQERSGAIERYVNMIEANGKRPLMLCQNSFLVEPGGVNTRIVSLGKPVRCMVLMQDAERVACGCSDGRILIVNGMKGLVEIEWKAHDDWVTSIAVVPDQAKIVSVSWDKTAKVWDAETGCCLRNLEHIDSLEDVAVMHDGKRVISVSGSGAGIMWDWETGRVLSKLSLGPDRIGCLAVIGDEEEIILGGADSKLRLWNVSKDNQVGKSFDGHTDGWVNCVVASPDSKYALSGSWDKTLRVWDLESHKQVGSTLVGHTDLVMCATISADGRRVVSGGCDRKICVWDWESRIQVCEPLEGHTRGITGVSVLASTDRILSSSWDGTIRVWDATREKKKGMTNRHEDAVTSVSFSPSGELVVSASRDRTIRIWNSKTGQQVGDPLEGHSDGVNDVVVTPDGRFIVSVSNDKTVRVWDLNSQRLLHTLIGHVWGVECVSLTPQGDCAVTGSRDKTVRVWNLTSMDGSHIVLQGHNHFVTRVFVSDDGLRVISIESDNIFVWEMKTKKLVKTLTNEGVA